MMNNTILLQYMARPTLDTRDDEDEYKKNDITDMMMMAQEHRMRHI